MPPDAVVAWQVVIDEFQHGFEFDKEQQKEKDSNAGFAARLLSAQGKLLKASPDLLLFVYSGTHMDFTDPHLQRGMCSCAVLPCIPKWFAIDHGIHLPLPVA